MITPTSSSRTVRFADFPTLTAALDFASTGRDVHSTWQGLAAFYEAPEATTLFGTTVQIRAMAIQVGNEVSEVGAALQEYAQAMRILVARLEQLRTAASEFVAGLGEGDDWQSDDAQVQRNEDLVTEVDTIVAAMEGYERQAANRINRLFGGTEWVVNDGTRDPAAYGFDPARIAPTYERPWGRAVEEDHPWYEGPLNVVGHALEGAVENGFVPAVEGAAGLVGLRGGDVAAAEWSGLYSMTVGAVTNPVGAGLAWVRFGSSLIALDEWPQDPARAVGTVAFNLFTLPFGLGKLGLAGKVGEAAAVSGKAGAAANGLGKAGEAVTALAGVATAGVEPGRPERYTLDKLQLDQPLRSRIYGTDMYPDSKGRYHFENDRVGTQRNVDGLLLDETSKRYIRDDNPQSAKAPDVRGEQRGGRVPVDGTNQAVVVEAGARSAIAETIAADWKQLDPIADKLSPYKIKLNESTLNPDTIADTLAAAQKHLTPAEWQTLQSAGADWADQRVQLRLGSERLGEAGGGLYVATEHPGADPVTGGEGVPGRPATLDRVVYDETEQTLVVVEEKGGSSGLGSRMVDDPSGNGRLRAEQMSPEYLRELLQIDNRLGTSLNGDAELRVDVDQAVHDGRVEYVLVRADAGGKVTYTEYNLEEGRWLPSTVKVAGS